LRGITNPLLTTATTAAEYTGSANSITAGTQTGLTVGADSDSTINDSAASYIDWFFRRYPSVFDIVCYTGNGSAGGQTISHNLTVAPELMIVKERSAVANWRIYAASQGVSAYAAINSTAAFATDANNPWKTPTSTTFGVGDGTYWTSLNQSGETFVAYLFATLAGVSKVGSYSGTGATQTINCGFAGGARWVMVKRTDSTGDWYVWDTTRGMVSGTDPSYKLNTTDAEVNANSVYTATTGFQIVSTAAGINASGGTYIFLAIA
jgi:hypothetical protein